MEKVVLKIGGMTCAACSSTLENRLRKEKGIVNVNVNLVMNQATIEYDSNFINLKVIERKIHEIGYQSLGVKDNSKKLKQENNHMIWFGLLSFFVLYLSMGSMIGLPIIPILDMKINPVIYALTSFLATTGTLILGRDILKSGWHKLIHRSPNMDTLVTLGVASAYLYSVFYTCLVLMGDITAVHYLYFESVAMVLFFIKIGKCIDQKSKNKTKEAIEKLMKLTPDIAYLIKDGKEIQVPTRDIVVGDKIIVKPGSKIAVDGTVLKGISTVDESYLTGESEPILKQKKDKVLAGSINYDGVLIYQADKIGIDTFLSKIVALVTEASSSKAPIARIADLISGYFVPVIMILAILTMLVWLLLGSTFAFAINIFISILVIACPCALGLATPLSIMLATGIAASRGILIKNAGALEHAQNIKTIVFDKTGTLTLGKPHITRFYQFSEMEEETMLAMIGSLEQYSEHPIGKAVVDFCFEKKVMLNENTDFKVLSGLGIEGIVENTKVLIGSRLLMEKNKVDLSCSQDQEEKLQNEGNSLLFVAFDQTLVALMGALDTVRSTSQQAVSVLQKQGIHVVMLTGDHIKTAQKIGEYVGISEIIANVVPEEKVNVIKNLQKKGMVMMVGDGINDAPSLVSAHIGVAIGNGTEIAIDSADVILIHDDLNSLCDFIYLSKKTIKNIKENLFWAFFYNCLMIPIAMGLFSHWNLVLNPMIAGFAMTLSSITVVLNALRLRNLKWKGNKKMKHNEKIKKMITIEGMSCDHCKKRVEDALKKIAGVKHLEIDLEKKCAVLLVDNTVTDSEIIHVISELGYLVTSIK